ncbi:MAG: amidohydrolase family protein [Gemmatimonadaceae bacterium]|nr:amidohydrolase family protein [Gemmatimonadaceae bacterium]
MRVDAHQHYWHFNPVRDAWIGDSMRVLRRDFLPNHVAAERAAAQIDAVVAVQADQSERETDFLLALSRLDPSIRGVVGWVDLRADNLAERIARWRHYRQLKGFRHIAQAEADDFLLQPQIVGGVQQLGALGFSYDLLVYPKQLAAAEMLVAECGDTSFVLDHAGKPPIASGDLTEWARELRAIAKHPNVTCKVSGLVTEASWTSWTPEQLVPVLDTIAESFGTDRLMFGSDWPVCLVAAKYARVYEVVASWASRLSSSEQQQLFGDTAARVYQLREHET